MTKCPICKGDGRIRVLDYGKSLASEICPVCLGRGSIKVVK